MPSETGVEDVGSFQIGRGAEEPGESFESEDHCSAGRWKKYFIIFLLLFICIGISSGISVAIQRFVFSRDVNLSLILKETQYFWPVTTLLV